jgi:hypothetical protein
LRPVDCSYDPDNVLSWSDIVKRYHHIISWPFVGFMLL